MTEERFSSLLHTIFKIYFFIIEYNQRVNNICGINFVYKNRPYNIAFCESMNPNISQLNS